AWPDTMSQSERGEEQAGRRSWVESITSDDTFRPQNAIGPAALLDAGLPLALFTVVYAAAGNDLTLSLWVALGVGAVLAVVRLFRREPLQNVVAGVIGLGIAAFLARRAGRGVGVFLPALYCHLVYCVAFRCVCA